MRLKYGEAEERFRREFVEWLEEHAPARELMDEQKRSSADLVPWARDWQRTQFDLSLIHI